MTDKSPERRSGVARYTAMGIELAGAVGGFCLLGWWVDRHWGIENHLGLLVGGLLGLVGGMYNLVRQALAAVRESTPPRRTEAHRQDGGDDGHD